MGQWKFQKHSEGASAKKQRRRGSRSIFGRSSEQSETRRCCSIGASAGRCKEENEGGRRREGVGEGRGQEGRVAGRVHEVFSCKLDILGGLIKAS
ncbi:hypothetical protein D8674_017035 [Pyrus ussuriensis x Pyrus communis]|uniref:Uncharacterized protein n=1 Tax=Pyrus ussuriensis x Pyrus communis TaxID=2448454 RepID=A0A5N5HBX0_9ROSA|nr:hypothetical protein D8674_017035 [Pyrus ussuriensis x Pyrus communis]